MSVIEYEGGEPILTFDGEFLFLSNFYPSLVVWNGYIFPTVEHAYQAEKNPTPENYKKFATALITPAQAKRSGRLGPVRDDWDEVKVAVMKRLLYEKFKIPFLYEKLLATGQRRLEEGNTWNDRFWGICPPGSDNGVNWLGILLMEIRNELSLYVRYTSNRY